MVPTTPALAPGKCLLCADGSRFAGRRARIGGDCRELRPPGGTGRHGRLHRQARPTGPVTAATVAPRPPPRPAHRAYWNPGRGGRRTSTISLGAGISAAAARNSSMDPNGSAVTCVNTVGSLMSARCSALLCPDRNAVLFSDRLTEHPGPRGVTGRISSDDGRVPDRAAPCRCRRIAGSRAR